MDYTDKVCSSTDGKIDKDTVKEIDIRIDSNIRFSKLVSKIKMPLKQFKYSKGGGCLPDVEHYENEQYGIYIDVTNDRINHIQFSIPEEKNFSCVSIPSFLSDLEKIKQIHLLESNRDDVQKIFADYKFIKSDNSNHKEQFEADSATIEFTYSEGKCEYDESDGYRVPEWKVEKIKISPENYILPKDFGFELSKYQKEQVYKDNSYAYLYHDKNLGISFEVFSGYIGTINFFPPRKYYPLMCNQNKAEILSSTESFFAEKLEDRVNNQFGPASAETLNLSQNEIILNCNSEDKNCIGKNSIIKVFVSTFNPNGNILTYDYTISGGRLIGQGSKVQWDLSDVKEGTYTISAVVDDGCGFCGKRITKKVVVKECSEYQNK